MNATNNQRSDSMQLARHVATLVSPETRELLTLARRHSWDYAVLGQAPLPAEPLRLGDWLVVPVSQDSSQMPSRALERVQAIYAAGLRPQGFVLVHEAPLLLTAPETGQRAFLQMSAIPPWLKSVLILAAGAVGVATLGLVALVGLAVLAVALAVIGIILVLPVALVTGAVLVDPILVAVTEDGYWIEIDRWASGGR